MTPGVETLISIGTVPTGRYYLALIRLADLGTFVLGNRGKVQRNEKLLCFILFPTDSGFIKTQPYGNRTLFSIRGKNTLAQLLLLCSAGYISLIKVNGPTPYCPL